MEKAADQLLATHKISMVGTREYLSSGYFGILNVVVRLCDMSAGENMRSGTKRCRYGSPHIARWQR